MMSTFFPPIPLQFLLLCSMLLPILSHPIPPSLSPHSSSHHHHHVHNLAFYSLEYARLSKQVLDTIGVGIRDMGALRICQEMVEDNMELLDGLRSDLSKKVSKVTWEVVDHAMTQLCTVNTNLETCLDELMDYGHGLRYEKMEVGSAERFVFEKIKDESRVHAATLQRLVEGFEGIMEEAHHDELAESVDILLDREATGEEVDADRTVVVAQDGSGNFTDITSAVGYATNISLHGDHRRFVIYVREGIYHENVLVGKKRKKLTMIGNGIGQTVVVANRSMRTGWKTFDTATLIVQGDDFIGINLTIVNSAGPENGQAVAVRNSANHSVFYKCSFVGFQDTLYVHRKKQFYRDCVIYGTVDFIFGDAAAVLQNCTIYARKRRMGGENTITAQGRTNPHCPTGISIHNSTIKADRALAADPNSTDTYLGRPWKDYSRTVFVQCRIEGIVRPEGWKDWFERGQTGLGFYGEYGNYGPGSNTSGRVHWKGWRVMNHSEALEFTVGGMVNSDGWLNGTNVPYDSGLLRSKP